ncbi:cytochrome P450 [Amycolatopsis mediterranei S699]|uniref:Cytochrome P450 n=2 Tax=Amycolatopsis mediterranei TaxID=33910 RepID=A0A0H3CXM9_AMYMU|nr:cytochrome P450 [Amycolatopsis mediterranei]ADJ42694.1 cytochrome P450 [Amycolatopsis mediterranei U32]AEK39385.1 cytochrome P450 [Amycolatopsis mediterranei S699]AFO74408.1 cytochrome P450 [Amycolatopsis mediterranei S699]AGT81537.1 cytochrome P450 [Amycolatopsis mediterranei RB]KDO10006.1 cytochrome P450 [Amycolatopsis mediterranei]
MTALHEFPMTRTCPFAPPPAYAEIREEDPVTRVGLPDGRKAWVVSRHEDVRTVLNDRRFSADRQHPDFPQLVPGFRRPDDERTMITMDAPEHGPARKAVLGEFTVRRMEALRPRIQEIVDERIDALLAGPKPGDLVEALSLPVPSLVICEMLGVPYADHDFFQTHTTKLIKRDTPPQERRAAVEAVREYMGDLIAGKEANPPDDLLGRQIVKLREEGTYRRAALAATGFLLLVAGHETTANMISLGTVGLLENPHQLALIRDDPGKTLDAVEELLRYFTIVDAATARLCVEDAEVGGQLIRAGEGVLALGYAANRDGTAFENPDDLDIERGARHHVAFGFGPHQCLGQNLARMELQIVFDTLFRRIPGLRLAAPVDDLPFKDDANIYGLYRLPVTW